MNYSHDMVDNIHQKRIWRHWNQCGSICLHLRRHIWNSRVHERSVTSSEHEGTPAWTKAKPSSSRRSHRKHTELLKHGYLIVVQNLPFLLERTVCIYNSAFKHTAWSTSLSPRKADDARVWRSSISHAQSPAKTSTRIFATGWRRLRYLPPR